MIVRNLGQEILDAMTVAKDEEQRRAQILTDYNKRSAVRNLPEKTSLQNRVEKLQQQVYLSPGEKLELELLLKKMWNI